MKGLLVLGLVVSLLMGCDFSHRKKVSESEKSSKPIGIAKEQGAVAGNYVDAGYAQRHEGYDWVAVQIKARGDDAIWVSVRSRADKKKPTCTFDSQAYKENDSTYTSVYDGKTIVYTFTPQSVNISTRPQEDASILSFFCSGGATLAGTYQKLSEPLDVEQMDKTVFSRVLRLQGINFYVSSVKEEGFHSLRVSTSGLEQVNYDETFDITGSRIVDAEVEDLNSDGSPELLIYTQSDGSGSYGDVKAFSVNNHKSMSQVYFPPTAENKQLKEGYMGHDEFTVVETHLVQRFPVYKAGDTNANPTGGWRQVSYQLEDGEAMRRFKVVKVSVLP
ncbi:PliI family lysozyme inhibitor of I-type lysozyme [Carboxylicivirga taeanensis]|uniref:PliI family lysozyme inhibitor of I-type lysozyme n=1 Tax=Carboxylicivirga taeanensis TaxID=1416875 RepID=UPI003F6E3CFD